MTDLLDSTLSLGRGADIGGSPDTALRSHLTLGDGAARELVHQVLRARGDRIAVPDSNKVRLERGKPLE